MLYKFEATYLSQNPTNCPKNKYLTVSYTTIRIPLIQLYNYFTLCTWSWRFGIYNNKCHLLSILWVYTLLIIINVRHQIDHTISNNKPNKHSCHKQNYLIYLNLFKNNPILLCFYLSFQNFPFLSKYLHWEIEISLPWLQRKRSLCRLLMARILSWKATCSINL